MDCVNMFGVKRQETANGRNSNTESPNKADKTPREYDGKY